MTIEEQCKVLRVEFRCKSDVWWCRLLDWLFPKSKENWRTLCRTIHFPEGVNPEGCEQMVRHELKHVEHWARWWVLYWLGYWFLPLPVLLAWCRWNWERQCYMTTLEQFRLGPVHSGDDMERTELLIDNVVALLWSGYWWPWPREWMRQWFIEELLKPGDSE